MQGMRREALKDMLGNLLDQVELDPDTLACRLHYHIGVESWDKVASPKVQLNHIMTLSLPFKLVA